MVGHCSSKLQLAGPIAVFLLSCSDHRQVVYTHVPLFTMQYKLLLANSGDAQKLGR